MYKPLVLLCVVFCVLIEARPKWQYLERREGYIPVYIRPGDTPLEEINPDLAEAFHALPAGRSAGKHVEASPDLPEQPQEEQPQSDQPQNPETPEDSAVDHRPYEKKILERKVKKVTEVNTPVERR